MRGITLTAAFPVLRALFRGKGHREIDPPLNPSMEVTLFAEPLRINDHPASHRATGHVEDPDYHEFELEFTPKIKLELKRAPSGGGCG